MKNIKLTKLIMVAAIIFAFVSITESYSKISIVVGKSSSQKADKETLKSIFLGSKLNWPSGEKASITDMGNSPVATDFFQKFCGSTINKAKSEWTKLVLSGQASAPIKCNSADDVKKAVNSNLNAVGYMNDSDVDGSVKVLFTID